jgi:WD40 repeat protein
MLGTLRADFIAAIDRHPMLRQQPLGAADVLPTLRYTLQPLARGSMYQVIAKPAELLGLTFDEGLIERLVAETGSEDALPLLAFALRRLWDDYGKHDLRISVSEYETFGGIEQAVGRHAEAILKELEPSEPELDSFRDLLLYELADIAIDGRLTRRAVPQRDIAGSPADDLVNHFVNGRLLIQQGDTIEVAHEAIYRRWASLREWVSEARQDLAAKARVSGAYANWVQASETEKPDRLLPPGRPLEEARELRDKRRLKERELLILVEDSIATNDMRKAAEELRQQREIAAVRQAAENQRLRADAEAARAAKEQEALAAANRANEAEKAKTRRTRFGLAIACSLMVLAASLGWWGLDRASEAEARARAALQEHSRFLTIYSARELADARPAAALQLALGAVPLSQNDPRNEVGEAWPTLARAVWATLTRVEIGSTVSPTSASFSPDGQRAAVGTANGALIVYEINSGKILRSFTHGGIIRDIHYDGTGTYLADSSSNGTVAVWNSIDSTQNTPLVTINVKDFVRKNRFPSSDPPAVDQIDFDKSGTLLAAHTDLGELLVYNWKQKFLVFRSRPNRAVVAADFSADSANIITVNRNVNRDLIFSESLTTNEEKQEGVGRIDHGLDWDSQTKAPFAPPSDSEWYIERIVSLAHNGTVGMVFQRSSDSSSNFSHLFLTDKERARSLAASFELEYPLTATISEDGNLVAAVGKKNIIKIWDSRQYSVKEWSPVLTLRDIPGTVRKLRFSSDDHRLLAVTDNDVIVWDLSDQGSIIPLQYGSLPVYAPYSITLARSAPRLALIGFTRSYERLIYVFDSVSGEFLRKIDGSIDPTKDVFSPVLGYGAKIAYANINKDGTLLVENLLDGTAKVWDLRDGSLKLVLSMSKSVRMEQIEPHVRY